MRHSGRVSLSATVVALGASSMLVTVAGAGVHTHETTYRVSNTTSLTSLHVGAGDFNGDGHVDLATAAVSPSGGDVTVSPGVGTGSFHRPEIWPVDPRPGSIASTDFNRDGATDVLVSSPTSGGPALLYGDPRAGGQNPWLLVSYLDLGSRADAVAAGDFNADGFPDAVASTLEMVSVFGGSASGFGSPSPFGMGDGGHSAVATGDFNGDGRADLVAVQQPGGNTLAVRLSDGNGDLLPPLVTTLPACCASALTTARLDGDERTDAVVTFTSAPPAVLTAGPDGALTVAVTAVPTGDAAPAATGDLNADGRTDLIFGGPSGPTLVSGRGDGTFGAPEAIPGAAHRTVEHAVDANEDGYADLVLGDAPDASVVVALNVPRAATSANTLSFGSLPPTTRSAAQTLAVTNDGQPPLRIGGIWFEGLHSNDFAVTSESCTARPLLAGESCSVAVAAQPERHGLRTAQLVLGGNSPAGHSRVAVQATGLPDTTGPALVVGLKRTRLRALVKRGLTVRATCAEACELTATLVLGRRDARRLSLPRAVGRADGELTRAGARTMRVRLSARAAKAFRRLARVRLAARVQAIDAAGNEDVVTRAAEIRR